MKKTFTLLLMIFLVNSLIFSQCLPDGILFTQQSEIDDFSTNYPGCTEILGDVTVSGTDITNLEGLSVVEQIGGNLFIASNPGLINLTGLENLSVISGNLEIGNFFNGNDNLESLEGFEVLESIGGNLYIGNNPLLVDISAIALGIISGNSVHIEKNNLLSDCSIINICLFIGEGSGVAMFSLNNNGCSDLAEVTSQCLQNTDQNIVTPEINIYPNPTAGNINVDIVNSVEIQRIRILDAAGNIVREFDNNPGVIDVAALSAGMYVIEVISDNNVDRKGFIKQ